MEWLGIYKDWIDAKDFDKVSILVSKWNGWEYDHEPQTSNNNPYTTFFNFYKPLFQNVKERNII